MKAASFQERARLILEFETMVDRASAGAQFEDEPHVSAYSLTWEDHLRIILGLKFRYRHPTPSHLHVLLPETVSRGDADWQGRMSMTCVLLTHT